MIFPAGHLPDSFAPFFAGPTMAGQRTIRNIHWNVVAMGIASCCESTI
jgi:hypothetical protein